MKKIAVAVMLAGVLMLYGGIGVSELGGDELEAMVICMRGIALMLSGLFGLRIIQYKQHIDYVRRCKSIRYKRYLEMKKSA